MFYFYLADGVANEKNSGIIASIAQLANTLDRSPIIYIKSEKRSERYDD